MLPKGDLLAAVDSSPVSKLRPHWREYQRNPSLEILQSLYCLELPLLCCLGQPESRFVSVLCNPLAILVADAQIVLRIGNSLIRGFLVPVDSLLVVLRHPLAILVADAQPVLRRGMPLIRGLLVPVDSLLVVLRHPLAIVVADAQPDLRIDVSLISRCLEPTNGLLVLTQAIPVVPLPIKGSSTVPFVGVSVNVHKYSISLIGLTVGWVFCRSSGNHALRSFLLTLET